MDKNTTIAYCSNLFRLKPNKQDWYIKNWLAQVSQFADIKNKTIMDHGALFNQFGIVIQSDKIGQIHDSICELGSFIDSHECFRVHNGIINKYKHIAISEPDDIVMGGLVYMVAFKELLKDTMLN